MFDINGFRRMMQNININDFRRIQYKREWFEDYIIFNNHSFISMGAPIRSEIEFYEKTNDVIYPLIKDLVMNNIYSINYKNKQLQKVEGPKLPDFNPQVLKQLRVSKVGVKSYIGTAEGHIFENYIYYTRFGKSKMPMDLLKKIFRFKGVYSPPDNNKWNTFIYGNFIIKSRFYKYPNDLFPYVGYKDGYLFVLFQIQNTNKEQNINKEIKGD